MNGAGMATGNGSTSGDISCYYGAPVSYSISAATSSWCTMDAHASPPRRIGVSHYGRAPEELLLSCRLLLVQNWDGLAWLFR